MEAINAFELVDISKHFGGVEALKEVSLSARPGTIHALCGENGAGKSTLMKILAGVYRPDSGKILVRGVETSFSSPAAAARAGISMLYQEPDLAEDLTVAENVFLGVERLLGGKYVQLLDANRMNQETDDLIDSHGFMLKPDAVVSTLPPSRRQQVELLKALNRKAHVLVMDEPTASLSEHEAHGLFAIIRELRNTGMSIVYISHRLDEVMNIADEVTVLRDGKVVFSGARSALNAARVVKLMVGGDPAELYPERNSRGSETVLEAKNVCDRAGRVNMVSFGVRRGEIVGMAGLVGSGRSETVDLICGVEPMLSGELFMGGKPVRIASPAEAVGNRIAVLPDDRNFSGISPALSGAANLLLPDYGKFGMKYWVFPGRERKVAERFSGQFRLNWPSPKTPGGELSAGTMRKILLGRWLLSDAELLIADEPTRGVDVESRRDIYELLDWFARRGKAVLLISSNLPELLGITDRILVMRNGRVVGDLVTRETTAETVMHLAAVDNF